MRYIIYGDSFIYNNNDSSKLRSPEKKPLLSIMFKVTFIIHCDVKRKKTLFRVRIFKIG